MLFCKKPDHAMKSDQRVALITGAARGIGLATARKFLAENHRVALLDIDAETLSRAMKLMDPDQTLGLECDVAEPNQVKDSVDRLVSEYGRIDVLVNNAGIATFSPILETSFEEWSRILAVNLNGPFICTQACAPVMLENGGGSIVNISSIAYHGNFGQSNYSAAKAGVAAMTVLWAKELAQHNIRVGAIAPGFTATEMVVSLREEVKTKFTESIPLRRFAELSEISDGVLFILRNDYVTGEIIEISGGVRI